MPRPDLWVLARFLDALHAAPEGRSRAQLQRAARVNYDVFRRYLDLLKERGLVDVDGATERIVLTPAGRDAHAGLVRWLSEMFGAL